MRIYVCCFFAIVFIYILTACSGPATPRQGNQQCGDELADVFVWEDLNSDGIQNSGEPPLEGVCIGLNIDANGFQQCAETEQFMEAFTDARGTWHSPGAVAGWCGPEEEVDEMIASQCSKVRISAYPPDGYSATTVTVRGCDASFGFVKKIELTPSIQPTPTTNITITTPTKKIAGQEYCIVQYFFE